MIDILVNAVVNGLQTDLCKGSLLYTDDLIDNITTKDLTPGVPNKTISVVESDSIPLNHDISSQIAQTSERYTILIKLLVKANSEAEGKALRRKLTRRIKHSILKKGGSIYRGVLTSQDTDTGYSERPLKYAIGRTEFDMGEINNILFFLSETVFTVDTDVNYYDTQNEV